jgi:nitroreductase
MELINKLQRRYATKKFDKTRKVSPDNLEKIKKAIQLSVSSFGLQFYKILVIENQELREELKPVSWNQNQITDSSHLFVFCNYSEVKTEDINAFIHPTAKTRKISYDNLQGYGDFISTKLNEKTKAQQTNWLERQPYIALANLLMACAELKIDACPMEGFEAEQYNEILGLNEKGLNACVIASIGYRDKTDKTQYLPKVRKPIELLFEDVKQVVPETVI